ncbi:YwmB family TATA-box binding protein [Paenibacillus sp. OV219]|uniref:YwmB family TATA-box binding protein n=1 Tax=Paenibacillus sp. OV219 TaxID=1884377 RepID=UPI0008CB0935|nr:YwmB family TATA-box binding protein [Paenibacillus sp. OV219]SEO90304.1 TATA-box binding [Paenibacillus sp. OV219]
MPANHSRQPKGGMLAVVVLLLILVTRTLWHNRNLPATSSAEFAVSHDFEQVWKWSSTTYVGGAEKAHWSFRWDGGAKADGIERLAEALGFTLSTGLDGDAPVDITATNDADRLKLWVRSKPAGQLGDSSKMPYELVLLLDTARGSDSKSIADEVHKVENAAIAAGLLLQGGFTVRGEMVQADAPDRIAAAAGATEVEAYDDSHTSSLTYYSKSLQSGVQSGATKVNLQIAGALTTGEAARELIIGVPLITGDYTEQK